VKVVKQTKNKQALRIGDKYKRCKKNENKKEKTENLINLKIYLYLSKMNVYGHRRKERVIKIYIIIVSGP